MDYTLNDWARDYQRWLFDSLVKFLPKETAIQMLDQTGMNTWIQAVQSNLWDPDNNYEVLEKIGDKALELAFLEYLREKLGDEADPKNLSEFKNFYLSKTELARFARQMGLDQWALIDPSVRNPGEYINIAEDLFEAHVGALFMISNQLEGGLGYEIVKMFVSNLFDKVGIDMNIVKGHEKTQVTQLFHRINREMPVEKVDYDDAGAVVEVFIPANLYNIVTRYKMGEIDRPLRLPPQNRPIGVGRGPTKKVAVNLAYKDALETLTRYGFNIDWVKEVQVKRQFSLGGIDQSKAMAIIQKMQQDGFDELSFFSPRQTKTKTSSILQLHGVYPDGSIRILGSLLLPETHDLGAVKSSMLLKYLSS